VDHHPPLRQEDIVDCPVDYSENMKLTERLKSLTAPAM